MFSINSTEIKCQNVWYNEKAAKKLTDNTNRESGGTLTTSITKPCNSPIRYRNYTET